MKRPFALGLAVLVGTAAPAIAKSEPVIPSTEQLNQDAGDKVFWLILKAGVSAQPTLISVPTKTREQCEMSGAEFVASKRLKNDHHYTGFECVEGIR